MQSKVDTYIVRRAHEYWAWRRLTANLPDGQSPPEYVTQYRHCPCGHVSPCPDHENETYGEFPTWFWSVEPHVPRYGDCFTDRHLPFRNPWECVPEQFRIHEKRKPWPPYVPPSEPPTTDN